MNQYVYGTPAERLFAQQNSTRTSYSTDALASVRALLDDAGLPQAGASYDAWGVPETAQIAPFGFTGELQRGNDVWLRARWYGAGRGGFGGRDPFAGWAETPYSMHPYQYAYSNAVLWTDASGESPQEEMVKAYFIYGPDVYRNGKIYTEVGLNLASRTGVRPDWPFTGRIDVADINLIVGYIYEIEPMQAEALAIDEITQYQRIYRALPPGKRFTRKTILEPKSLRLGYGFPKEWRVMGTDPLDPTKAIRAKQTVAGVVVWDREDKLKLYPYPEYVYEYDPKTRRAKKTKPDPALWPRPIPCPAAIECPPGLDGLGCLAYYVMQHWMKKP